MNQFFVRILSAVKDQGALQTRPLAGCEGEFTSPGELTALLQRDGDP